MLLQRSAAADFLQIGMQDFIFQCAAQTRTDRMDDIAIVPVRHAAGGHGEKEPVVAVDDFDIVHGEGVVEGDRYEGAQAAVLVEAAEFDVGDLHVQIFLSKVRF